MPRGATLSFRSRTKYLRGKIQCGRYISQNAAHISLPSFLFLNLEYFMYKSKKEKTLRVYQKKILSIKRVTRHILIFNYMILRSTILWYNKINSSVFFFRFRF